MRIEKAMRRHCSENELACKTSPPLTQEVFQEFKNHLSKTVAFASVQFRESEGLLYVTSPSFSSILISNIDNLLSQVEKVLAMRQEAETKQARLDKEKKDRTIKAMADAAGLPIE
jgi:hypothetical protein